MNWSQESLQLGLPDILYQRLDKTKDMHNKQQNINHKNLSYHCVKAYIFDD